MIRETREKRGWSHRSHRFHVLDCANCHYFGSLHLIPPFSIFNGIFNPPPNSTRYWTGRNSSGLLRRARSERCGQIGAVLEVDGVPAMLPSTVWLHHVSFRKELIWSQGNRGLASTRSNFYWYIFCYIYILIHFCNQFFICFLAGQTWITKLQLISGISYLIIESYNLRFNYKDTYNI